MDSKCVFRIMRLDFPWFNRFWVLGLTFFHDYYIAFDADNKKIGIAESTFSNMNKAIVSLAEEEPKSFGESQATYNHSSTFNFILVLTVLVYVLIMVYHLQRRKSRADWGRQSWSSIGDSQSALMGEQSSGEPRLHV